MHGSEVVNLTTYEEEKKVEKLKNLNKKYDHILETWIKLFKELNITNPIEICNFISYLLYNGYFSKDKILNYQIENRLNTSDNYAFDIMSGNGVCINFSCMLKKLLEKSHILSSIISLNYRDTKSYYEPNITTGFIEEKEKVQKNKNVCKCIINIFEQIFNVPNHVSTLICDNNMQFIYDITNLQYFKIKNLKKIIVIEGVGHNYLNYRFNYEVGNFLLESNIDVGFNTFVLEEIKKYKEYTTPTGKEIINLWGKIDDLFNSNIPLLDDCYMETKKDIDKIADYVEEEKNKKLLKKGENINV